MVVSPCSSIVFVQLVMFCL